MAYSVVADVQSEFRAIIFSGSSQVTTTEVTEYISQTDEFINGRIGTRYATPVAAAKSIIILKTISLWLTASRVAKILKVKTATDATKQDSQKSLKEMAMEMIVDIESGKLLLSDGTLVRAGGGVASYNVDNAVEPNFHIQTDEW